MCQIWPLLYNPVVCLRPIACHSYVICRLDAHYIAYIRLPTCLGQAYQTQFLAYLWVFQLTLV